MELKQIKAFVTVADMLSFSRASELLYTSQSAISKQISALEADLNVRLLQRDTHSVMLTDAGAAFLSDAHEILALCDKARDSALQPGDTQKRSTFRIMVDSCFEDTSRITGFIVTAISRLRRECPELEVKCSSGDMLTLSQTLINGQADLAIMVNELTDGENLADSLFNTKRFFSDSTVIMCSDPEKKLNETNLMDHLKKLDVVYLDDHMAYMPITNKMLEFLGFHPTIKFCSSYLYLLSQIAAGKGFTLLPFEEYNALRCPYLSAFPVLNAEPQTIGFIRWRRSLINPYIQKFCAIVDALSVEESDPTIQAFNPF